VIDAVEELLEVHVRHPAPAFLDEPLRRAHRIVGTPSRPEAVAVRREGGIELRLQHLKQALLDEPVEHGRDAQLTHPASGLGDLLPFHRLRLIGAHEQLRSDRLPVRDQVDGQVVYGHPVDAGTAPVLPHALQRRDRVGAFDHGLHQAVVAS
jgi:hypothetical protein